MLILLRPFFIILMFTLFFCLQNGKPTLRVRFGGFLPNVDLFDSSFFSTTGAEADLMDPQQRLLLETSWEAVQAVGNATESLLGGKDTGVFIGIQQMEYGGLAAPHLHAIGPFSATGGSFSVAAGRLSFTYGFKGPAVSMDTACSSAMVATHTAANYIRSGSNAAASALAGGVNLLLSEATTAAAQAAGMLTPDGRCKALDAAADGYVRAEACIVLVLSVPQAGSTAANAVLKATAVNQDGRSSSLTAPNGPAQQAVLRAALTAAGLSSDAVETLQMHGTGTALGDPIEIGAAIAVLPGTKNVLRLAAAKSRVGHAEPVAGLVGLIHAADMMHHSTVHAISHLTRLNPIVATLLESKHELHAVPARQDGPAAARGVVTGASAFAFQGTNAHALVSGNLRRMENKAGKVMENMVWQRRRHWFAQAPHVLVRAVDAVSTQTKVHFSMDLNQSAAVYLLDHQVGGRALLPGAAMVEACHFASTQLFTSTGSTSTTSTSLGLTSISIASPYMLPPPGKRGGGSARVAEISTDLRSGQLSLASHGTGAQMHLSCTVGALFTSKVQEENAVSDVKTFNFGVIFAHPLPVGIPSATANLARSGSENDQPQQYNLHPATLDCATQTGSALQVGAAAATRVPVGLEAFCATAAAAHGDFTALATLQGRTLSSDAVMCGYKLISAASPAAEISGMQFKPIAGAASLPPSAQEAAAAPGLYVVDWQGVEPASLACKPRDWEMSSGNVTWQMGPGARVAVPMPSKVTANPAGLHSSLQLMQVGVAASGRPEITLNTPLIEPGLPDMSAAYAAAAGLLKVAAQEHSSQRFKHAIHDGFNAEKLLLPADTDIFGVVAGEGLLVRPRMVPIPGPPPSAAIFNSTRKGSWLITGGVGDVGRLVGFWASQTLGVANVILLGRSGRSQDSMKLGGEAVLTVAACDISTEGDLIHGVLQRGNEESVAPIDVIFHASAVLKDGVLTRQTAASLRAVYVPKVLGATRLRDASDLHPVNRTVYCSSLSAQLGTPGQSNYAAANAALDAQAQIATNSGLAAGSVLWGPWASGMALQDPALLQRFQKAGLTALTGDLGLGLLGNVLGMLGSANGAAALVAAGISWGRLLQGRSQVPGIFAEFAPLQVIGKSSAGKSTRPGRRISLSVDTRSPLPVPPISIQPIQPSVDFHEIVKDTVQGLLGQDIASDQPLMEAGLDSLGTFQYNFVLTAKGNHFFLTTFLLS